MLKMFQTMKPILDENISWFIYENEKPIAMWINIPDLNQWLKYLNGKFGWIEKLKFLMAKFFIKNKKMVGLVFVITIFCNTGKMLDKAVIHIKHSRNNRTVNFHLNITSLAPIIALYRRIITITITIRKRNT